VFDDFNICPYTGLRSFTEEESIYFKGREENIEQSIEQLQQNKFLMLTGASGDGKSSLVYAGIIPNARANFLKSRYTQWVVADFRPERTPYKNLCSSLAAQLDIENVQTVEAELKHGFSALVELYRNSPRHLDTESADWLAADENEKRALKRKSANLLILVDQFEEFFTNPENYHNGAPSRESNLVLNLLLETARIALEEDLPIYVVFTMRSDFIGQCAAFRGLPEYIGFSQFFVPRLNRTQLQQVIEEPAALSGNRITRRLTERLIHDLTEGVDQLPILQHALNQIWHAADNGKEEMDLIHYAMVGGMPAEELPGGQQERYRQWFGQLSPEIKDCYREPGLQNVLDTHTNKLYQEAGAYYQSKTGKTLPDELVNRIIKTAFSCLTKIDQSRAVRNRMTLKEITDILNHPEADAATTGIVLNIFREPGNTFIRPFITENDEGDELHEDTVMDITHESLIRNWRFLEEWALEEFDNYNIFLDFEKQLNRWLASGKSGSYLLSIGPLVYFENWYERVQPNAYWIARYLPEELERDKKLEKAKQIQNNAREFLALSANKHLITRTVMHYGTKKIAGVLALLLIVSLAAFGIWDFYQKQDASILLAIKQETIELANRSDIGITTFIPTITEQMIADNLTVIEVIDGIENSDQKIKIATAIASQLVLQGRHEPAGHILQSLQIADSLLANIRIEDRDITELTKALELSHNFSATSELARYFNPNHELESLVKSNAERAARWAMYVLENQPAGFTDVQHLNHALDTGLNHNIFTENDIERILAILSPFEAERVSDWITQNYNRDRILVRGGQIYGTRFNGLYQLLATFYAAAARPEMAIQSVDSILSYQNSYFENDYDTHTENATNIAVVFYTYGHHDQLDTFVNAYTSRKNTTPVQFYNLLVSRSFIDWYVAGYLEYYIGIDRNHGNSNIKLSDDEMLRFFFGKYRNEIQKLTDPNARSFNLAMSFKNEGLLFAYRNDMRPDHGLESNSLTLFDEAVSHYLQTSPAYLNQTISVTTDFGSELLSVPRKFLFQYPDFRVPFHVGEARGWVFYFKSPLFINHLIENNLFDRIYNDRESLRYFENWFQYYHAAMTSRDFLFRNPIPFEVLEKVIEKLEERDAGEVTDLNLFYLHLADFAFNGDEPEKGISYIQRMHPEQLLNSFRYTLPDFPNTYSLELVAHAVANLFVHHEPELAYGLVNTFRLEVNRSSIYAYASQMVSLRGQSQEAAVQLLDSARVEMNRLENPTVFQPNRHNISMAYMYLDPENNSEAAYEVIRNSPAKFAAMFRFSLAEARYNDLYSATQHIPDLISGSDRAFFLGIIVKGNNYRQDTPDEWKQFRNNELFQFRRFLPYINESI
jgi:hypothetical protein